VRSGSDVGQGFELYYDYIYMADIPCIIKFYQPAGDVQIKDLTAQVIEPNPCDPWIQPWNMIETTALCNFFAISDSDFNTKLTNLRMKGAPGEYIALYGYVLEYCESDGRTHIVKECDFENSLNPVEVGEMSGNSRIIITENTFSDHGAAMYLYNDNMNGIISYNTISHIGWGGIYASTSDNNRIQENDISDCRYYGINVRWDSSNNLIIENTIKHSGMSDLFWDGTGTGNTWTENKFKTKTPNIDDG
jgi:parallel beta-helix repeat protein